MTKTPPTRIPEEVAIYPRYLWRCPVCRGMNLSTPCVLEPTGESRRNGERLDPAMYTAPDGVACGGCDNLFVALFVADEWDDKPL